MPDDASLERTDSRYALSCWISGLTASAPNKRAVQPSATCRSTNELWKVRASLVTCSKIVRSAPVASTSSSNELSLNLADEIDFVIEPKLDMDSTKPSVISAT